MNKDIYIDVIEIIRKEEPEYLDYKPENIKMFEINGINNKCVFVYRTQPLAYDGSDFIYCSNSTNPLVFRRM